MRLYVFRCWESFYEAPRFIVCASSEEEALKKIKDKFTIKGECLEEENIDDPDNEIWVDW